MQRQGGRAIVDGVVVESRLQGVVAVVEGERIEDLIPNVLSRLWREPLPADAGHTADFESRSTLVELVAGTGAERIK